VKGGELMGGVRGKVGRGWVEDGGGANVTRIAYRLCEVVGGWSVGAGACQVQG
jgi:hypothetical protein